MAGAHGGLLHMDNIFQLLESSETVKDIRKIILENLHSTNETWLIQLLVERYFQSQSPHVQEILAEIRESQAKVLLDKLHEGIKSSETRLASLQLTCYLVYRELPWQHRIMDTPVFSAILKCLKTELDVPILMTALMTVVMLLPSVPVAVGTYLTQIFEVFERLAVFCVKKPANTPETFVLHLQVGLYSLFHRLYGMYPCSFTAFISKVFAQKDNIHVYHEVVQPMLDRVRLHPKLIMGHKENETSANRWKNQETHDIVVSCSKLSLDLIEGSWEDSQCPVFRSVCHRDKTRLLEDMFPHTALPENLAVPPVAAPSLPPSLASSLQVPPLDVALGDSPSVLIGLSTPPSSQRTTPAPSFLEGSSGGPPLDTPEGTPSKMDDADRTSGSGGGATRGGTRLDGKRPPPLAMPKPLASSTDAMTSPGTGMTSVTHVMTSPGSGLVSSPAKQGNSSPFKSSASAFGSPRSSAVRSLHFPTVGAGSEKETSHEGSPITGAHKQHTHEQADLEKKKMATVVPMETLSKVVSQLQASDAVNVDHEVEAINEGEDHFDPQLSSTSELTAESVRQFMKKVNRIRFNSLTSNSSSDLDTVSMTSQGSLPMRGRARSCPPFKRPTVTHHTSQEGGSSSSRKAAKTTPSVRGAGRMMRQKSALEASQIQEIVVSGDSGDDLSSYGGSVKDTPKHRAPISEEIAMPASVNPVFQYILAPAKLAVCGKCHSQLLVVAGGAGAEREHDSPCTSLVRANEVSLFSLVSPPEVLDRHLRLGSDIHAKQLSHLPLTCKDSTNWTHFGGMPPADEVNILRGQILLLQNQLMYERHKRTNHAKRNRRLLRRIAHMATLEEQHKALAEQVGLKQQEVGQLKVSIHILQGEHRCLQQSAESDEYEKLVQFRTSLKENKDLKAERIVLKNLMLAQREEYDKQQSSLESVQHRHMDCEKELELCKTKLSGTCKLQEQVFHLQKEVLLMQELHQKCQEKLAQQSSATLLKGQHSFLTTSLKTEMEDMRLENNKKSSLLEAYQTRNAELEAQLLERDSTITEMKRKFEGQHMAHEGQVKVIEERCAGQVRIIQEFESRLMEQQGQMEQQEHKIQRQQHTTQETQQHASHETHQEATHQLPETLRHIDQHKTPSNLDKSSPSPKTKPSHLSYSSKSPGEGTRIVAATDIGTRRMASYTTPPRATPPRATPPKATPPSVVKAKGQMSVAGSTFSEDIRGIRDSRVVERNLSSPATIDLDLMSDSGQRSASIASVQSVVTADSGCWPKVDD